ncbi:MAG: germination protein YpeB [Clostridia bacterium]|nr:germination protein YpeB [Clostridia bacterium]
MEATKKKHSVGVYTVLVISLAALALMSVAGVYYYRRSSQKSRELENVHLRAFHDMADYVNDIDVGLKKILLANDAVQMSAISSALSLQAEGAKACLAQFPSDYTVFETTSEFLSQVGNYCTSVAKQVIRGEAVSDETFETLQKLSAYAENVNAEFSDMETRVYESGLSVEALSASPFVAHAAEGFDQIEDLPQDYPSLIYDGPFSDHLETARPAALEGRERISRNMAEREVSSFLGDTRAASVKFTGDGSGKIETYLFEGGEEDRDISIEITKYGGEVLWMLDSRKVTDSRLSVMQAMAAGEQFLMKQGYPSMKSSYFETADNVATVNYAYSQNGVTMYPDLVKVKIALDNGEILGFESQGYQMCHKERILPVPTISEADAIAAAGNRASVDSASLSVIPTEGGREVFCYELKGSLGKTDFLIYVNAETGQEENILLITETEYGMLTV